jgi:hypothetical protein
MFVASSDSYIQSLTDSLWSAESWFKVVFLLVTAPVWFPILRTMVQEVREVLAPEGGLYATKKPRPIAPRAPGDDPFLNIPYASHRGNRHAQAAVTERIVSGRPRQAGASTQSSARARPRRGF